MATLTILSAGAAQSAVCRLAGKFQRDSGNLIHAEFGAAGAMRARVAAGEPVDVVILPAPLMDDLCAAGLVAGDSCASLGSVGTGVAVRAGTRRPDVRTVEVLRANILAATRIVCPDPAVATAGKVVLGVLDRLGVATAVRPRLQYFPDGQAAMAALAGRAGVLEMGISQLTEIIGHPGVSLAGPLPAPLQVMTAYAAGLAVRSAHPERSRELLRRLTGFSAQTVLSGAGFAVGGSA